MTDPFEHGFEVAQRRRLNLPPDLPPDLPPGHRKRWQRPSRISWQVIVVALGVVVLLAIGRAVTSRNATGLKADCTKFQLAVAEKSLTSRGAALLHWAATAPAGTRFTVTIDRPDGDSNGHAQQTPTQTMGRGCLAHGQFGVLVPPGRYNVSLVRPVGAAEERMAFRQVTVTAP
jgi:hypothetical protein